MWKSNSVITKRSEVPAKPSQKLSHHVSFLNGSLASLYPKEASKNVFGINHQPSGLFSNPNMGPKDVQCDQGHLNSPSPYSFARNIDLFQMKVENFVDTTTLCYFFLSTLFWSQSRKFRFCGVIKYPKDYLRYRFIDKDLGSRCLWT